MAIHSFYWHISCQISNVNFLTTSLVASGLQSMNYSVFGFNERHELMYNTKEN
jgi:hypothetical protein